MAIRVNRNLDFELDGIEWSDRPPGQPLPPPRQTENGGLIIALFMVAMLTTLIAVGIQESKKNKIHNLTPQQTQQVSVPQSKPTPVEPETYSRWRTGDW